MQKKDAKILVVDDQAGIRALLKLVLASYQDVRLVGSAEEALDLYESFQPDLMLLDVKLPKANGFELVQKINSLNYYPKVIIMTAYLIDDYMFQARREKIKIADFLEKPFDIDLLLERVSKVLEA